MAICAGRCLDGEDDISVSLVAAYESDVIGFILGSLHTGEFGFPENIAFIDTIGIARKFQGQGIGNLLMVEFERKLRKRSVWRVHTLVDLDNWGLIEFFINTGFSPSPSLNLEKQLG